jgi:2-phosphosulfolactate phosphatase
MTTAVDVAWGAAGAKALASASDVLVVVDVLSFTTSLTIAVDRGAQVWPYAWGTDGAEQFAREIGAVLARGRSTRQGRTLSPASLLDLEDGTRLVLPSPNGSAIAHAAASSGVPIVAASLRNAAAATAFLTRYDRVGIVAAGERWTDGSLRPAYEDWIGAGVVIEGLLRRGTRGSPDAEAAAAAAARPRPLAECTSGLELVAKGFAVDVELAQERDVCSAVAFMQSGRFSAA